MEHPKAIVVIPNWDGKNSIGTCLDSLLLLSTRAHIIVVDNGSVDGSVDFIKEKYPQVEVIEHDQNKGFAGGVNAGIKRAFELEASLVALLNNDAFVDKDWLQELVNVMKFEPETGIVTGKLSDSDNNLLDSTGECYSVWGLPFPRGRGESVGAQYDKKTRIFGASGGASLYRLDMLREIGLFDEDFFAYYEDVDISFRAQLAGWKVSYAPDALAYHQIGATSSRIKGFTTYQTFKNLPFLLYKNVPRKYLFLIGRRFLIADILFFFSAVARGHGWAALKGRVIGAYLLLNKSGERKRIQSSKKVTDEYIWGIMTHDLPPNAHNLRALRARWSGVKGGRK